MASIFLHTSILGAKPKMVFVRGDTDTYKSLMVEIMKKIITSESISKVPVEQLADKFGLDLIADKMLNYSEEQNATEPKDPAALKDAVTMESGFVTRKYSVKQSYASGFPKHIVMCNKIAPIAADDDDNSIFNRNQYVEINPITQKTPHWRKEILDDESEIKKIGMFLLHRASDILNNKERPFKQQDIPQSKEKYKILTQGSITAFLDEFYMGTDLPTIGTLFTKLLGDFKKYSGNSITNKAFEKLLEEKGYEVSNYTARVYNTEHTRNSGPFVFDENPPEYEKGKSHPIPIQKKMVFGLEPKRN